MPRKFNGFSNQLTRSQALFQGDFTFLNRNTETFQQAIFTKQQHISILHTENRQELETKLTKKYAAKFVNRLLFVKPTK